MRRLALIFLVLIPFAAVPLRTAGAGSEPVVKLPPFEVKDNRPWLYAEIPGLQVLSLASERDTRVFVQRLQDVAWLTPLLLPPGLDRGITAPSSLFLQHFAGNTITTRLGAGLGFPTFTISLFLSDTSIVFPSDDASRAWAAGREYLNLDFMRVTGLTVPRVPAWFRDGMGELLRSATGSARQVTFPAQTWKQPLDSGRANAGLNPFAREDPPRMGLGELFALRVEPGSMSYRLKSAEDRQRYLRGAALLVHWGFFDRGGRDRAAFLKFVAAATAAPADEAMVQARLGLSLKALQSRLDDYAFGVPAQQIPAPKDLPPAAPVSVRPATRGEVARIVGEAYLHLADSAAPGVRETYLGNAREVLEDARESGEVDAAVFQQLGALAQVTGAEDEAIAWLQRAVSADVPRPSAYVSLAELRLKRLARENPGDSLAAADTAAVWSLLQAADTLRPRSPTTYSLAIAMWLNSSVEPTPADLLRLADGVDAFPGEVALLRDALRLFNKRDAAADPALAPRMAAWRKRLGVPMP
jgi:hypothetical protein